MMMLNEVDAKGRCRYVLLRETTEEYDWQHCWAYNGGGWKWSGDASALGWAALKQSTDLSRECLDCGEKQSQPFVDGVCKPFGHDAHYSKAVYLDNSTGRSISINNRGPKAP